MSKYCPKCGRQLADSARFCDSCGLPQPDLSSLAPQNASAATPSSVNSAPIQQTGAAFTASTPAGSSAPGAGSYAAFQTLGQAVGLAINRNSGKLWSRRESPKNYSENFKALLKFCEKEDDALKNEEDRPVYIVSPGGALGQIYERNSRLVLEWLYYTDRDTADNLPRNAQAVLKVTQPVYSSSQGQAQPTYQPSQTVSQPAYRPSQTAAQRPAYQQPVQSRPAAAKPQRTPAGSPKPASGAKTTAPKPATSKTATAQKQAAPKTAAEQKKGKSGCGTKFLVFLLVAAIAFTGFVKPGFFLPKEKPPVNHNSSAPDNTSRPSGTTVKPDARELSSEVPQLPETLGNSKALDYSPCEGFHVTAPENTFAKDTVVTITPMTQTTPEALKAAEAIEDEGYMLIGGYEVHADLAEDEVAPGEYTVTVDLSILGIDPDLYQFVRVFRVADDGSYYEYAAAVEDGKLTYRSDQNSFLFWAISAAIIGSVYGTLSYVEGQKPFQYFYDLKKKKYSYQNTYSGVTYKIHWAMDDIDVDADELTRKCEEITRKYMAKKDEIYKQYKEDRLFDSYNILNVFDRGKSATEVLWDTIKKDEEYQDLQQKLKVPDLIDFTIICINRSIEFLKGHESVKMPTGVVDFVSVTTLDSSVLAEQSTRNYHEGYVEINLKSLVNASQVNKNDFLITITHELLHVCQQKYRYFWADSNRYDEMVAVYMEERALNYYLSEYTIAYDAQPPLSSSNYWTTLKLPTDMYYYSVKKNGEKDGSIMKFEGYNLGLFVKYLEEKTGKVMWTGRLMHARASWKEPGISGPLMSAFGISEMEYDIHYRNFIRKYKTQMVLHYDTKESERYKRNEEIPLVKGEKYHVDVRPEGPYCSEVRGFKQPSTEPITLLLIPDQGFSADQPECNLLPVDKYEAIPRGAYIYPKTEYSNKNRDILEIHGALGKSSVPKTTGYTIYALDQTKVVIPGEDNENLLIKLPDNSVAAEDGLIDGYILTIEGDNGVKIEKEIPKADFETELKIPRASIYGDTDPSENLVVTITLCEFIKKNATEKLYGEVSEPVYYEIGRVLTNELNLFTGAWIPLELKDKFKPDDWIIGLIYIEEYNEFGEFEGPAQNWTAKGRWLEIKYFDYDEKTGVLTIDFDANNVNATGVATFRINAAGNLIMSNSGGSWEFYRAPED
ncbi:MAG: zinc-ribbon domain-containing protein [Firmicutes bacterium]|nr:zinc-ribbon domain-containing protein [Bacillota bacterium]